MMKFGLSRSFSFPRSAWERTTASLCVVMRLPRSGRGLRYHAERGNEGWDRGRAIRAIRTFGCVSLTLSAATGSRNRAIAALHRG